MATLYVTEQNAILRKTSDRIRVEKDGDLLVEVPCIKLDAVLIFGNVQVTTQALVELLDHGIELAILSTSGRLRGQLTPPKAKNVPLRMRQYALAGDEAWCRSFAAEIVRAKIDNSLAVVQRFRSNHPEALSQVEVEDLERCLDRVGEATTLDSLRGMEGTAAARYFECLAAMVPPPFLLDSPSPGGREGDGRGGQGMRSWTRTRRPPRDPLNALLSFGYVLVGNELQSLLDAIGFDPYIGFFHQVDYGRPSLALDLLEELRPALVDRFSVNLLNLGVLEAEDFTDTADEGTRLTRDGLKRFFAAYEKELTTPMAVAGEELTFRTLFRRQAERLARALVAGEPYQGFRLPC
jgi:CRISPR-associated protein Cas1